MSAALKSDVLVEPPVPEGWATFERELPHQSGDMRKRNWGHPWHSLCSYQGKLKPAIAHTLVRALVPEAGGRVLDPFAGVGTIPLEAKLAGHMAFGFDINPAAIAISRAKVEAFCPETVENEVEFLSKSVKKGKKIAKIKDAEGIRFNGEISDYFHRDTFVEILAARMHFRTHGFSTPERSLVLGCLLHILHGNRPYALSRKSHPITPFAPSGPAQYKSLMHHLQVKVERVLKTQTVSDNRGKIFDQDATTTWPNEVNELDAIITSPPFFDSTRFYSANWMRLWFAGWGADEFASEPARFVEVRQKTDFDVYLGVFRQAAERLKPGGHLALHLGKSAKCDMAASLAALGSRYLQLVTKFTEDVGHCQRHGIRDQGAVTEHQYVLFRRA